MSDETYYTVLNVQERVSSSKIKTAYRDLIKQVHPDTIANLAPYLKKIAEDKAKEINEAYTVLSSSSKRRDYDRQLAEYRRRVAPQTPPAPHPTPSPTGSATSFGFCNRCGTSLYASGFCPKCNKSAAPAVAPPQPKAVRRLGYNWAPLLRWSREHPLLVISTPIILVWVIAALSGNGTSERTNTSCLPSQKVEVNGNFVCPSPIPVSQAAGSHMEISTASAIVTPVSAPSKSFVLVSGTYLGTVHNQTVNLSSSFAVVIHQAKGGMLEGCMEVKPPLYGSGTLHGSINGSRANFEVADIKFHGDALKNTITGSYVVSRQDGEQLGDFRLEKRKESEPKYHCDNAVLKEERKEVTSPVIFLPPEELPSKKLNVNYAIVASDYAAIEKRCAFLPSDNYGRCHYEPETIARPRKSDRLMILSPLTRAENGEDIYRVRTRQGWEGWINSKFLEIQ